LKTFLHKVPCDKALGNASNKLMVVTPPPPEKNLWSLYLFCTIFLLKTFNFEYRTRDCDQFISINKTRNLLTKFRPQPKVQLLRFKRNGQFRFPYPGAVPGYGFKLFDAWSRALLQGLTIYVNK
jgi:hypothetical protein